MPFGVVSGVGLRMGVLDFDDDRRMGREAEMGVAVVACPILNFWSLMISLERLELYRPY